jgi:hypothetical protein
MTRTASFTTHAAKALSRRRTIPVELPEFAIRALEHRVEMTNAGADEEEMVSFNDVVEWYLLSPLSVKDDAAPRGRHPRLHGRAGAVDDRLDLQRAVVEGDGFTRRLGGRGEKRLRDLRGSACNWFPCG